jgi:hypothetical protein
MTDFKKRMLKQIEDAKLTDINKANLVYWLIGAKDEISLTDEERSYLMALVHLEWRKLI